MKLKILDTYDDLSAQSADEILACIAAKPAACICLASGDTPKGTFEKIIQKQQLNPIDLSQLHIVSLDEWVGLDASVPGSCRYDLNHRFFFPLNIKPEQIHFFDGLASDLNAECQKMNEVIDRLGGIDLMLLGIGMNGHLGFNEPGVDPSRDALVVPLDPVTLQVGQKYFQESMLLTAGITQGLSRILKSKYVILQASGKKKAGIIQKAIQGPIDLQVPASILQSHLYVTVYLDREAASLLD
jgi:glucosamine-6-phosphate isomerase